MTCLRSVPSTGQHPGTQPSPPGGISFRVIGQDPVIWPGLPMRARGTLPHACRVRWSDRPDAGGPPNVQAGDGSTEVTPG